jgi:hypothetical protein
LSPFKEKNENTDFIILENMEDRISVRKKAMKQALCL